MPLTAALSRRRRPLRCAGLDGCPYRVLAFTAALSRRLRPLRGPRVYEGLLLASGCPFASPGVRRCPGLTKSYSLLRSWRVRRTVALEPIFPLVARVSLWR